MAKAKPKGKKPAKTRTTKARKAKTRTKPRMGKTTRNGVPQPPSPVVPPAVTYGKPLIVIDLDDFGNPVESWLALEYAAGFPTSPATTVSSVVDAATGTAFDLDNFNLTGTSVLNIGFFSNANTAALVSGAGVLQITLQNGPPGWPQPVPVPVDYIDDDDLP